MTALGRLFGWNKEPEQYPTIATDEVFPLFFLDNHASSRKVVANTTFKYDQPLDPEMLRDSLTRLIEHGDWRKLGGRLRMRSDGDLELHVPKEFTEERPAIGYSKEVFDVAIEEHPLGKQMPTPTPSPSLHPGAYAWHDFANYPNGPTTLQQYLTTDSPVIRLHITCFTNATIVTVVFPHAIYGALGFKNLLIAWSTSLQGDKELPALLGAHEDIMDGIAVEKPPYPYGIEAMKIRGWGFVKFALRTLWTVFVRHRTVESRMLFIPRDFMVRLKAAAMKDLKNAYGHLGDKAPFVSESDVLTAWTSRFIGLARGGQTPAIIFNPFDFTSRIKAPWMSGGFYVQNLTGAMFTPITADTLVNEPLGELALVIRKGIQEQATEEQVLAQIYRLRQLGHNKTEGFFGDPSAEVIAYSNWTKFDVFNHADFAPAVTKATSSATPGTPIGKPSFMQCHGLRVNPYVRNFYGISGKDLAGNYWMSTFMYPDDWAKLERFIKETEERI